MVPLRIDLYSDTQTRPTPAMRAAMAEAPVGDEQHGEDPSVNALIARMCALTGKEAAVFLPSGTMCNEIALLVHCRPGDEVLADRSSHIIHYEGGAPGALAGVMVQPLDGVRGVFEAAQVKAAIRPDSRYFPRTRLVAVEQTANLGGGTVWPLARLQAVAAAAREARLATHMDGARLMNAVVKSGVPASDFAEPFDTVWLDFTKGLGAPLGAVLCGSAALIEQAWRWKQRLGGGLRQSGICAAGCLYALDHHVARLAEDHANAAALAAGLARLPGVTVEPQETNLVFFDVAGTGRGAQAIADAARAEGLRLTVMGETRMRACTHLDVTAAMIPEALEILGRAARA